MVLYPHNKNKSDRPQFRNVHHITTVQHVSVSLKSVLESLWLRTMRKIWIQAFFWIRIIVFNQLILKTVTIPPQGTLRNLLDRRWVWLCKSLILNETYQCQSKRPQVNLSNSPVYTQAVSISKGIGFHGWARFPYFELKLKKMWFDNCTATVLQGWKWLRYPSKMSMEAKTIY